MLKWLLNMLFTWTRRLGTLRKVQLPHVLIVWWSVLCAEFSLSSPEWFLCKRARSTKEFSFFLVTVCSDFHLGYWELSPFRLICLPTFFHLAFSSLSAADGLRLSFALIAVWKQSNDFLVWKIKNQRWHASVWECILRCLWNSGAGAFICRWCNYK